MGDEARDFRVVTLSFLADGGDGYTAAVTIKDRVDLVNAAAPRTGEAGFAGDFTEQDALAAYLPADFVTPDAAFAKASAGPARDERIQNLAFCEDTDRRPGGDRTAWQCPH